MKRDIKPDEHFKNNSLELIRTGNLVKMKDLRSHKQKKDFFEIYKNQYNSLKREIDELVFQIRAKVIQCNPLSILKFSNDIFFHSIIGITSEIQDKTDLGLSRMTEYIQSIIVSSPSNIVELSHEEEQILYNDIQKNLQQLYTLIEKFYLSWGFQLKDNYKEWGNNIVDIAFESQNLYLVRGDRYQVF